MQKIGILGGTFDPIHNGHLLLAREVLEKLHLDEIRFIPTGLPPHRDSPLTPPQRRLDMVRLAMEYKPGFVLDDREIRRNTICYTVDTLTELRTELGQDVGLYLLLGSDAFLGLPGWHDWQRLFELAHIVVAGRPGTTLTPSVMSAELLAQWQQRKTTELHETPSGSIIEFAMTPTDISASHVRKRLAAKQTVRGLVPNTVLNYILQQHLYEKP